MQVSYTPAGGPALGTSTMSEDHDGIGDE